MISSIFLLFPFIFISASHGKDRPIIGVLTQESKTPLIPEAKSDVLASYVKFIEAGGGRVVPIAIRKPYGYYQSLMNKLNGVLFTGGPDILEDDGYGRSGRIIFDIATKMNDEGDFFPLWGTCLGFEMLHYLAADKLWMTACQAKDLALNIGLQEGFKNSRLFKELPPSLENSMRNKEVTIHYHGLCLTPENYTLSGLDKYFNALALNRDRNNLTFISVIEAFNYPYYGTIFHPEKVLFEHEITATHRNIPKSLDAIRTAQYFSSFFVDEARKSNHSFPSKQAEDNALIYNYNPFYSGKYGTYYAQIYYFSQ